MQKKAVEPVIQSALDLDYRKRIPGIYLPIGIFYILVEEDFPKGKEYLNDVFEIGTETGDFLSFWIGKYQLGTIIVSDYQFDEAISNLQTALDLSVLSKNLAGMSHSKGALAMIHNFQGKQDMAFQMSTEALECAAQSGDILALQPAYTHYGASCYYKGHLYDAEKYIMKGLAVYEKAAISSWGMFAAAFMGFTFGDRKDYGQARKYHQKCLSILEDTRMFPSWLNVHKLFLAKIKILNQEPDLDPHDLDNLIAFHDKNRLAICESFGTRCIAEIYMLMNDHHMEEAEAWIKRAIDFNTKHDTKWELARDRVLYADWFKKKGDVSAAREQLSTAINLFRECGADGWVEKYERELALM
jgi:tetratricopeptide (TPR) repeat protein